MDKNSTTPLYIQIEQNIMKDIENKTYVPGSMIPTERELTQLYNVSRMTVRQAISKLVNGGVLYKIRGKGTFVTRKVIEKHQELRSFSEDMISRGLNPGSRLLEFKKIIPDKEVRNHLNLFDEDEIYFLKRMRLANDECMAIEYCHLPMKHFLNLTKYNFEENSLYEILKNDYNLQIAYAKQMVRAVTMTKEEALYILGKKKGFGLQSTRTLFNIHDIPVEYTITIYHPERYMYNMILKHKTNNY